MTSRLTHRSAFGLVGLTAFLLVFGSTVRVHGAGLSCPDWPLCFGQVVPEYEFRVYLEFGHRVVAGVVSLWFLAQAWLLRREGYFARSPGLVALYVLAGVVLATQVVLGGLTVLELLAEWTVASHLVTGNTFALLLLFIALSVRQLDAAPRRDEVGWASRGVAAAVLLLVPTQIVLGGLVSGSHAGLACGTWPSCNGAGWFPTFEGLVGLQVMHRVTAYTLAAVVLGNLAVQWRNPRARVPALSMVAVVTLQITLGVLNVLTQLPVEVTLAHSAGAALLYLSTGWMAFEVWTAPLAAPRAASASANVIVEAK